MRYGWHTFLILAACYAISGCATPPPAVYGAPQPDKEVYRVAARRFAAVVVSESGDVDRWLGSKFDRKNAPKGADGGSAVPVAHDGYFLTADHVLAMASGKQIYVILRRDGRLRATEARVIWRSAADDLALIHAPVATPDFYHWTESGQWLPQGTGVMHSGIATGFSSPAGKLLSSIPPETGLSGNRRFKHDIPLEPGDSGGAVVDARGMLVGINSAVEFLVPMETAFFIESEGNRPNVGKLMKRIANDRARNGGNVGL